MLFVDALLLRNLWCQTYKIRLHLWFLTATISFKFTNVYMNMYVPKKHCFYDVIYKFLYNYIYVHVSLIFPCFKCIISCKLRWEILLRLCVDKTQTWQSTLLLFMLLNFLMHFWPVNNVHFCNLFVFLLEFYDWYKVYSSI